MIASGAVVAQFSALILALGSNEMTDDRYGVLRSQGSRIVRVGKRHVVQSVTKPGDGLPHQAGFSTTCISVFLFGSSMFVRTLFYAQPNPSI